MKTLVIVAHPQLDSSATEAFFKTAARQADNVTWHELTIPFDVVHEQQLLHSANRIILQFPMYWYSAPAILKQWLDEAWTTTLTTNRLVKGHELGIVVTVAHPAQAFMPGASQQFTIAELLRPYQALAHATGMKYLPPLPVYQFAQQSDEQRQLLFIRYQQYLTAKKFQHFSDRTNWFAEQLTAKLDQTTDPLQQAKMAQLLTLLTDQQDELTDLQASIGWLREREDD
ncbi:NAD(P)H-dependent oxidoreductase [Limosilactobacillus caccae]|uniref:NAD(P)H-dependent oxidoreductase n=1 Tax=Limosilactobacillus caccae TaxID=1926284 RepID=UPI00097030B7|nr:NAD(P)H-dependent oxidoreductase [Limosilactobacillus caccae]